MSGVVPTADEERRLNTNPTSLRLLADALSALPGAARQVRDAADEIERLTDALKRIRAQAYAAGEVTGIPAFMAIEGLCNRALSIREIRDEAQEPGP